MEIVRLSGDPLIQDSLRPTPCSRGCPPLGRAPYLMGPLVALVCVDGMESVGVLD